MKVLGKKLWILWQFEKFIQNRKVHNSVKSDLLSSIKKYFLYRLKMVLGHIKEEVSAQNGAPTSPQKMIEIEGRNFQIIQNSLSTFNLGTC